MEKSSTGHNPQGIAQVRRGESGFSLAAMLIFMSLCAVILATWRISLNGLPSNDNENLSLSIGLCIGAVIGCIRTAQGRRWRQLFVAAPIGLLLGGLTGAMAGYLCALPAATPVALVGAVFILLMAWGLNRVRR